MGVRAASVSLALLASPAAADPFAVQWSDSGRHFDAEDTPTFQVGPGGVVDWFTYAGYAHYDRSCRACHGDPAVGTDLARPLAPAVLANGYHDFVDWVVNGGFRAVGGAQRVMPAFGTNPRVMCDLDEIFVYLRAVAAGALSGPPEAHAPRPEGYQAAREACLGD